MMQIMANQTTLAHGHGRAALLRRLLADQQVSPTGLAFVPTLTETAILSEDGNAFGPDIGGFHTSVIPPISRPPVLGLYRFPTRIVPFADKGLAIIGLANYMAIVVIIYAI
jgi:hypothetical protein